MAPMTSSVWKIMVKEGDVVKENDVLVILEAMKMEIRELKSTYECMKLMIAVRVDALGDGKTVKRIGVKSGSLMDPGQVILTLV